MNEDEIRRFFENLPHIDPTKLKRHRQKKEKTLYVSSILLSEHIDHIKKVLLAVAENPDESSPTHWVPEKMSYFLQLFEKKVAHGYVAYIHTEPVGVSQLLVSEEKGGILRLFCPSNLKKELLTRTLNALFEQTFQYIILHSIRPVLLPLHPNATIIKNIAANRGFKEEQVTNPVSHRKFILYRLEKPPKPRLSLRTIERLFRSYPSPTTAENESNVQKRD